VALGPDDLVCSHFTLTGATSFERPRFGFAERVAAAAAAGFAGAAAAGFAGIGLLGGDHELTHQQGLSDPDLAVILADHGIVLAEVEFLMEWSAGPEEPERLATARMLEDQVWAVADAFGPRVVSVGEIGGPEQLPPFDVLAERFGALCDRAAAHGLLVALEFVPWSGIPDIVAAADLVRAVDRSNAGINLDTWHWFRGNPDAEVLRAVADRVFVIQLDDADRTVVGTLFEDTTLRRRYPGDGSFDLVGLLMLARDAGVEAPVSVEVMSTEHYALPVAEAARRAHDTARAVVDRAWH
jgi:sugar phosphate isomerase/epimerase